LLRHAIPFGCSSLAALLSAAYSGMYFINNYLITADLCQKLTLIAAKQKVPSMST
jgi:hypothetical protein